MKRLLLALIATYTLSSCATFQQIPIENNKLAGILPLRDGKVYYESVETIPGASAEMIYRQARRWVAFRTIDPKAPFGLPDILSRDIVGPGVMQAEVTEKGRKGGIPFLAPETTYTVSVETFPNRYRLVLTSFRETVPSRTPLLYGKAIESGTTRKLVNTKKYFRTIDRRAAAMAESFKQFVIDESSLK